MPDPSTISGLKHWYRADDVTGVDGTSVSTWADRGTVSPNAMVQATGGAQPVIKRSVIGGKDAVRFNGSSQHMKTGASAEAFNQYWTLFYVGALRTASPSYPTGLGGIDENNNTAANNARVGTVAYTSATVVTGQGYTNNSSTTDNDTTPATVSNGAGLVMAVSRSSSTLEAFFNGSTDGPLSTANTASTGVNTVFTAGLRRGAGVGTPGWWNGDVAEIIIFDRALTTGERAVVHSYVQDRYGITVADYVASGISPQLTGSGSLVAGGTPSVPNMPVFTGSGSLAGQGAPTATGTATLSGSGTVSASQTVSVSQTASLSGSGTLSSSQVPSAVQSVGLSGSGGLVTVSGAAVSQSVALSGSGTVASVQTPAPVQSVSLSGSGSLSSSAGAGNVQTVSLSGSGSLVGASVPSNSQTVSLSGSGSLAGSTAGNVAVSATLSGSGSLLAGSVPALVQLVNLSGAGTLSAVVLAAGAGAAGLSGSGSLGTSLGGVGRLYRGDARIVAARYGVLVISTVRVGSVMVRF